MSTIDSGHYGDCVARRAKRLWTDEEKRSICFQTTAPGVSVAQVARRYAVNANLIFKWLRDARYAPDTASEPLPSVEPRFLPVEIVAEPRRVCRRLISVNYAAMGSVSRAAGSLLRLRLAGCSRWAQADGGC